MKTAKPIGSFLTAFLLAWGCSSSTGPDNRPPSISVTYPASGTTYSRGDTVRIEVAVSDTDGSVAGVHLYADDALVGADSTSPYQLQWNTREAAIGEHVLRLVATDNDGWTARRHLRLVVRWTDVAPEPWDDGWATSTLGAAGIDADRFVAMVDQVSGQDYEFMHAILVARSGKLVFDEYFNGFTRDAMQHVQSTTKSFTSALVGIAIDRGEIASVTDPMFDYLLEYAHLSNEDKAKITIQHCLMMAAGLQWNEWNAPSLDSSNDNIMGHQVPDYIAFMLAKPVVNPPGTVFYYNSGCPLAMGAILRNTTGMAADTYAREHLFGPLGITAFSWPRINGGKHVGTHGSLYVRPRDMAKFGQLFLQEGLWEGERVISEEWVEESTEPRITIGGNVRYGYQWWFDRMAGYDVPFTAGYGGQHIFVVPELDLVIVTAADYSDSEGLSAQEQKIMNLVRNIVLPAVIPD